MSRFVLVLLIGCNAEKDSSPGESDSPVDGPVDDDGDDDGFPAGEDCDDAAASVYPGAVEVPYDGIDQDCADGDVVDLDADGYDAVEAAGDDCDDADAAIHPGVEDVPYDGIDQDCSGADLDDLDGDGSGSEDCDDADPEIHPDAAEIWYDGIDQDCRADCDYDADHDDAVSLEWHDAVTDGSVCDQDPGAEIGVLPDCDDADPLATTQKVESVDPPDGAIAVDVMGQIEVHLHDNEVTATVRLLDPNGVEVPTQWYPEAPDWLVVYTFDPVSGVSPYPLQGSTTYTVEVQHSCGTELTTFTTGAGLEPVDTSGLVGATWELVPDSVQFLDWSVMRYLFFTSLGFVTVEDSNGATLDLLVAAADPNGGQDLCVPTGEILGVDFATNPRIIAGPFDYPVTYFDGLGLMSFPHQAGTLEATLFGDDLIEVRLSGFVETEAVATAAGIAVNQPCNVWGCVACPDGSGVTCLEETYNLAGTLEQSTRIIVPRTAAEIAADPACP